MVRRSYARTGSRSTLAITAALVVACAARAPAPDRATAQLITRAEEAQRARRYDRARALYERAKREAPSDADRALAARELGRSLLFWGEHAAARAELEQAARLAPDDAGTWHDLGMLLHHQGDVAGAEAAFERSIALRPDDGRSRIALAALLWRARRHREALRQYQALRQVPLPAPVRARVEWAIGALRRQLGSAE